MDEFRDRISNHLPGLSTLSRQVLPPAPSFAVLGSPQARGGASLSKLATKISLSLSLSPWSPREITSSNVVRPSTIYTIPFYDRLYGGVKVGSRSIKRHPFHLHAVITLYPSCRNNDFDLCTIVTFFPRDRSSETRHKEGCESIDDGRADGNSPFENNVSRRREGRIILYVGRDA